MTEAEKALAEARQHLLSAGEELKKAIKRIEYAVDFSTKGADELKKIRRVCYTSLIPDIRQMRKELKLMSDDLNP